jgi:hypothetical protein
VQVVDGSIHPESISDDVAFGRFFHVLAKSPRANSAAEDRRRVAYLKYFFRPNCGPQSDQDRSLSDSQIQRLLGVADTLAGRMRDLQAGTAQRQELIKNAFSSLDVSVDPDAAAKIRAHVQDHVKRRIRIVTSTMPDPRQGQPK